jgi:hypothetical protein
MSNPLHRLVGRPSSQIAGETGDFRAGVRISIKLVHL